MQKIVSLFIVFALLVLTILSMIFQPMARKDTEIKYKKKQVTGLLTEGSMIEYLFTPEEDIIGIKFMVATYEKEITSGKLTVAVFNHENNEGLSQIDIGKEELKDNRFVFADIGALKTKDRNIRIVITGSGFKEDEGVALYTGANSLDENAVTKVDGIEIDQDLIITTCYLAEAGGTFTWELLLLTAVSFLVAIMQWNRTDQGEGENEKEEIA